jgi:hypothetical protein
MKKQLLIFKNRTKTYRNRGWGLGLALVLGKGQFPDLGLVPRPISVFSFSQPKYLRGLAHFLKKLISLLYSSLLSQ